MIIYPATPVRNPSVSTASFTKEFSDAQCDEILASIDENAWEEAMVGGQGPNGGFAQNQTYRSNRQQRLPMRNDGFPLSLISSFVCQANSSSWKFRLSGVVADDLPWLMRYDANGRGHNDWHVDIGQGANASRKIGFSLQLSHGEDYEGGDLEFLDIETDKQQLRQKGTLISFPAYCLHRVAPVTKGQRYVVVGWLHGDSFR